MDVRIERSGKRVRGFVAGTPILDSTEVRLVWERPYYPTYFFPRSDVTATLTESSGMDGPAGFGRKLVLDVSAGDWSRPAGARAYRGSDGKVLDDLVAFDWSAVDHWFEEDEEVFVHARDPYKRIDVLESSRHIVVEVAGEVVADTTRPKLLFETGLPTRYYLPQTDVRMDRLIPTVTPSRCPYKGVARWWSVRAGNEIHADLAWGYPHPVAESVKIAGLVSFYNEKTDISVDGRLLERPQTPFSG